jgi:hypothetical protein
MQLLKLRSFSIEETADTVEDTVMTDTARSFITTLTSLLEVLMFTGMKQIRQVKVSYCWRNRDYWVSTQKANIWRYLLHGYCFGDWRKSFV